MKKNIYKLGLFLLGLLLLLIVYLSYIQLYQGEQLANHPKNVRWLERIDDVQRGSIYDRNGQVLAQTKWLDNRAVRKYPFGSETGHLLGYVSNKYGHAGLEAAYSRQLLGLTIEGKFLNLVREAAGKKPVGADLILTLDIKLQRLAAKLLADAGGMGAIVLIDPRTGAILAAVSAPAFDPNQLEAQWAQLINNPDAPFLNRAFQGAYPPGSVMKLVTAAGALAAGQDRTEIFNCPGYLMLNGFKLLCHVHDQVDLTGAIASSCNTVFGQLGLNLGAASFIRTAEQFAFKQDFALLPEVRPSTISADGDLSKQELASAAIGQGELLVSPLHMAVVTAAIANNGQMKQPYLVQEIRSVLEKSLFQHQPNVMQQATDSAIAQFIGQAMVSAVQQGTAKAAAIDGITVAGKTGTAQNPHGAPHAWFVGFAPAGEPRVAVAVIVENAGSGATVAAPVAQQLTLEALR
ncbi:penicillin-binding transpeptidase domain-containing protein [Peptococcaceae bacterium]|nr:penicillin-binding transpeptidase domain-containing protein [Peptococcaceae bacterium]